MLVQHRLRGAGDNGSLLRTGATATAAPAAPTATASSGFGLGATAHGIDGTAARIFSARRNGGLALLRAWGIRGLGTPFRTRPTLAPPFTARLATTATAATVRTLPTLRTLGAFRTIATLRTLSVRRIIAAHPGLARRTRFTRGLSLTGATSTTALTATATIAITAPTTSSLFAVATAATRALGSAIFRVANRATRTGHHSNAERARTEPQETAGTFRNHRDDYFRAGQSQVAESFADCVIQVLALKYRFFSTHDIPRCADGGPGSARYGKAARRACALEEAFERAAIEPQGPESDVGLCPRICAKLPQFRDSH